MEDVFMALGLVLYIGGMTIGVPIMLWLMVQQCNAGIPVTGLC